MNNNIQNQNGQSQHPPLTADRMKAALGNATLLQSFLLPKAQQGQQPQTPQGQAGNPQEQPAEEKPKEEAKDPMKEMELLFTTKLDEIRQELKQDSQREIDQLRETITSALSEPDEPNKA